MKIDAHQHFWKYNQIRDTWMDDSMKAIRKDFLPEDLKPILKLQNIDGCITVQADQSEKETNFLLQYAKEYSFIKGVVGWVDLCAKDIEERLHHFSSNQLLKGIRHIVQAEADGFMIRKDFQNGISKLKQFNLAYDVLIMPHQLSETIELISKFPDQLFVLNHLAKPNIKEKKSGEWSKKIIQLSQLQNVYCKISGLVTEANWTNWKQEDFKPYLDVIFKAFGTDRLLYGSDWPVCLLASNYNEQFQIVESYLSSFSFKEKEKIMGLNAVKVYNIN